LRDRAADSVVPTPFGRVVSTPSLPLAWDLNVLRVEQANGTTARDLAQEADRLQGAAGLRHRRITVLDDAVGDALADDFRSLGWRADRFLYMARRRPAEKTADLSLVSEVEWEALRGIRAAIIREEPWGKGDDVVRDLLEGGARFARAGRARHFAVVADGEVVSAADLYTDGEVAQVEDVATLASHRGHGYATAVVLRAVEEALRTGHELVFLVAADDDWPKELYARLGFDPVGRKHAFLKPPPEAERAPAPHK
ncbi:MAG: GNAT family N-acetyltransferase, partial [Actinomycetota bacterium]|nr:GNAT family N-acetyltransferase [Actinomycetota bacterium]